MKAGHTVEASLVENKLYPMLTKSRVFRERGKGIMRNGEADGLVGILSFSFLVCCCDLR